MPESGNALLLVGETPALESSAVLFGWRLSYSLGALAIAGFSVAVFVSTNEVAYPSAFYGPITSTTDSVRAALASVHAGLGFLALLGHLWHASQARAAAPEVQRSTFFDFMAKEGEPLGAVGA